MPSLDVYPLDYQYTDLFPLHHSSMSASKETDFPDECYTREELDAECRRCIKEYKKRSEEHLEPFFTAVRVVHIGSIRGYMSARSIVMPESRDEKKKNYMGVPLIEIPSRNKIQKAMQDVVGRVHDQNEETWELADKDASYIQINNFQFDRRMTATLTVPSVDARLNFQPMINFLNSAACSSAETITSDGEIKIVFGFSTEDDRDDAASDCAQLFKKRPTCHRQLKTEEFHMLPLQTMVNIMLKTFVRDGWEAGKQKPLLDLVFWGDQRSNAGNTSFRVRFLDAKQKGALFLKKHATPVYHIAVTPQHEGEAVQRYLLPILQNVTGTHPKEANLRLRFITGLVKPLFMMSFRHLE